MNSLSAEKIAALDAAEIPAALEMLAAAIAMLGQRIANAQPTPKAAAPEPDDTMLTVAEAAAILRKSTKWVYRHRDLPFVRKVGASLLISKRGMERWLERQKPSASL